VAVLGDGSNVVVATRRGRLVLRIGLRGVRVEVATARSADGSGREEWDELVARCVARAGPAWSACRDPARPARRRPERRRLRQDVARRSSGCGRSTAGPASGWTCRRPTWLRLPLERPARAARPLGRARRELPAAGRGAPTVAYPELEQALAARRGHRRWPRFARPCSSCGAASRWCWTRRPQPAQRRSFFVNPVLAPGELARCRRARRPPDRRDLPSFAASGGRRKVPAPG